MIIDIIYIVYKHNNKNHTDVFIDKDVEQQYTPTKKSEGGTLGRLQKIDIDWRV